MEAIIDWLVGVENLAAEVYREAAKTFAEDPELFTFLSRLAEEETSHGVLVSNAGRGLTDLPAKEPSIEIDEIIQAEVEANFKSVLRSLREGGLNRGDMLQVIAATEFAEWNEIFLYLMAQFCKGSREYQKVVSEIERHRLEIEGFLESQPKGREYLEKVRSLPGIWSRKILVVEDDIAVAHLLQNALKSQGRVDIAVSGQVGMEKIRAEFFDVIVSDVDMGGLSGLDLYRQACEEDPEAARRFVFYTASRREEDWSFFHRHKITSLRKPAPLSKIRQAVDEAAGGQEAG